MMRLLRIGVASLLCLVGGKAFSDTILEFGGTLVADPCILFTDSEHQVVDFGPIAAKSFINHSRSRAQSFVIKLAECDLSMGNSVQMTFFGEEDSEQPGTFAVTGDAAGIAIALEDSQAKPVTPGKATTSVALNNGDTQLNYRAYIQANDFDNIKVGEFTTTVVFSMEYE